MISRRSSVMHRVFAVLATATLVLSSGSFNSASAETIKELQAKSQSLQSQIEANNNQITELSKQEESLQGKIQELNLEISKAQTEIEYTQVKLSELEQRLTQTEAELERQKGLLKAALRALYARRDASTVELLVMSDTFSDFINEQQYLERLQVAVKDSTDKVLKLKAEIEQQKTEQQQLLTTQKEQKSLLAARQQEQQTILDQTQGQEDKYRQLVASQQAELEESEKQLAALLAAAARNHTNTSYGPVSRGDVIGRVGSTGYSTGPHVHFQVYSDGSTVNPYAGGGELVNGYSWPLPRSVGANYVTQLYGCVAPAWYYSVQCADGHSFHSGLDIRGSAYDPITAAADGEIIFRGCKAGLGYVVVIDHGDGLQTWYPHQTTPEGQVYGYC